MKKAFTIILGLAFVIIFESLGAVPKQTKKERSENTYSVASWWKGSRSPFSPEIHTDGSVTFRVRNQQAKSIKLQLGENKVETYALSKISPEVWETTVRDINSGIYSYWFEIDGVRTPDIHNPSIKIGTQIYGSVLEIPAEPARFDQYDPELPAGSDHIHYFYSEKLGGRRSFYVHTPPGYDETVQAYPVLYLRHGGGDHAHSWLDDGKAGILLDNLVGNHSAVPMIIVMPECLTDGSWAGGSDIEGMQILENELLRVIMPTVRKHYRIATGKSSTAIAGLSMGGGQALLMGLKHPHQFGWIAAFSSGLLSAVEFNIEDRIPDLLEHANSIKRIIGTDVFGLWTRRSEVYWTS